MNQHNGEDVVADSIQEAAPERDLPGQGEVVSAGFICRDGYNMAELPIIIPIERGVWRSVNYTSRDHFIEEIQQPLAASRPNEMASNQIDRSQGDQIQSVQRVDQEVNQAIQQPQAQKLPVNDQKIVGSNQNLKGMDIFIPQKKSSQKSKNVDQNVDALDQNGLFCESN